jgi:hypothetical protein
MGEVIRQVTALVSQLIQRVAGFLDLILDCRALGIKGFAKELVPQSANKSGEDVIARRG